MINDEVFNTHNNLHYHNYMYKTYKGGLMLPYLLMLLFSVSIIAIDQLSKIWVMLEIPMYSSVKAIPGLFHLTYVRNTGAAFSMLEGAQGFFIAIIIITTCLVVWEFYKKYLPFTKFERWCIIAMISGGISNNLIDRLRWGYVVDMIELDFMEFAIFNIADCFIVCGCIALMVSLAFFNKEFWKDNKPKSKQKTETSKYL